jgi:predicted transcriptional regulator
MAKFKDFGSRSTGDAEPISFKIYDQEFHCVAQIQGKVLLNMVANTKSDDPSEAANTINTFFETVLKKESLDRFNALLENENNIVTVDTLGEIVGWLTEQYANRPTEGSSAS